MLQSERKEQYRKIIQKENAKQMSTPKIKIASIKQQINSEQNQICQKGKSK